MHRMKETSPAWTWLRRLFPCCGSHQNLEDVMEEKTVVPPVSASAMASAERALRWISKVPGARRAEVKIGSALEMIKGLNVLRGIHIYIYIYYSSYSTSSPLFLYLLLARPAPTTRRP
ncbi:hypothetical protein BS47DRAFT_50689 [Hydnum rufescens UP504]|uniref:Uncharacterized protein n=1 Tax=Hydnum rufescens UP504 TaxID=1448309 RepID=A0A9P6DR37_9AGAM|nr:hypothetical protein BS47DRAFT_50689 [Hydnum rufescens UP504]